jgi:putative nucleotidyltransferase with HDIG domain
MKYGITRDEALALVRQRLRNSNLVNHCLATEAVMRALARRFGADPELWGLAGLLHDLDAETRPDLQTHTLETAALLAERGVAPEIIDAIRMHNEEAQGGRRRQEVFHHALAAGETITGLIVATALVYPDRKLASVQPKSVRKRFKERQFAAGADRDTIAECEKIGIPLDEFCEICLRAMQEVAVDLGL